MKIGIVLGTRPEIIKSASIILECERRGIPYFVLHTGQNHSPNMGNLFFRELELPKPRYNLGLGGLAYAEQVGSFVGQIARVLEKEKPDVALVQGDTTSGLAGALAASKLSIPIAHHEAGLRSGDTTMLEEVNRILVDHISKFLFVPTVIAMRNLKIEGTQGAKMFLTGNTITDAVKLYARIARKKSKILKKLALQKKKFFLVTAHRAENVDRRERLESIMTGLTLLKTHFNDHSIVYPIHPRTRKRLQQFGIKIQSQFSVIDPVGYYDMLELQRSARLIITDSGGVQEEGCILNVPVVTIRDNTERPETLVCGANVLVPGIEPNLLLEKIHMMLRKEIEWSNPYGDGRAGKRIISLLSELL
ncbi:UDP-N-acetylglucosamine 2-epimerase (non-hydrolyzing) [Candidatus Gottesmanbacteria bacterium]|nr:UDP-N-acetylglucosamine 2-epimerase (non-hydrolyzing) [Candidatus Gottesmanbacteria bacterium]